TRELIQQLEHASPAEAAERLGQLSVEERGAVLRGLPSETAIRIAAQLPDTATRGTDHRLHNESVISSVTGTVRDLMTPTSGIMDAQRTVAEAVAFLVQNSEVSEITYIYVVDHHKLVGVVVMRDLILARPGQQLAEIMVRQPFAFSPDTEIGEAVQAALTRHYPVYPVVDAHNHLLGVVRGWMLFERVAAEISAQAGSQVGLTREEKLNTPIFEAFKLRHPWLQVNLLTAFMAAFVVSMFEDTITRVVVLAAFLPVLAGQSGNTGCQALAITLRGMTLGQFKSFPLSRLLRKEILLGVLNGIGAGLVAAVAMWAYATYTGAAQPIMLGAVILLAMVFACVGSGIFGVMVPVTLRRFGADPAMASSIFLTTFTDILGMGLMLLLATSLLL
ncbi:MAG: magnesium transporter, partial [Spongiibacteraceae bacterium]|nr:magnesium transporter [Spongiibacteraceae bacterium]